jgi:sterol desaturase/sphingolipid hydroxylase (fatty acid hydroxylase superfamily)
MEALQTQLSALANPFELSGAHWLGCYVVMRIVLFIFIDGFPMWVIGPRLQPLPSRHRPVFQHKLKRDDFLYLFINSFIEYIFLLQLVRHCYYSPNVVRTGWPGLANGPLAVYLLLVFDDMLYAPTHKLMHWKAIYKYVHKHHHRNTYPKRGYIDGANEHPLEQITALCLHWAALRMTEATAGVHVAAVLAHVGLKAMGAVFNHTGFDLQFKFLGIEYSVRAHETHHRRPNTNFAQYVMFWDKLMGTYADYSAGAEMDGKEMNGKASAD